MGITDNRKVYPQWLSDALADVAGHMYLHKDIDHPFGVWCQNLTWLNVKHKRLVSYAEEGNFVPAHGWTFALAFADQARAEEVATAAVQSEREDVLILGAVTYKDDMFIRAFVWDSVRQDVVSWLDTFKGESYMQAIADVFGYPRSVEVIYRSGTHTEFVMQPLDDGYFHIVRHATDSAHKALEAVVEVSPPRTEAETSERLSEIFMQYWAQYTAQPQEAAW